MFEMYSSHFIQLPVLFFFFLLMSLGTQILVKNLKQNY